MLKNFDIIKRLMRFFPSGRPTHPFLSSCGSKKANYVLKRAIFSNQSVKKLEKKLTPPAYVVRHKMTRKCVDNKCTGIFFSVTIKFYQFVIRSRGHEPQVRAVTLTDKTVSDLCRAYDRNFFIYSENNIEFNYILPMIDINKVPKRTIDN